ncbi:MAG: TRAP transporter fused permease subunit, partial [Rectinemataceae bacterium]
QIMPPIMGIGAFIMAEMLGVPYMHIAKSAIIPALAYYMSVFFLVTLLAKKRDLDKTSNTVSIEVKPILPRLYLLLPAFILVYFMIAGASLMRSAMYGIYAVLILNIVSYFLPERKNFVSPRDLLNGLVQGSKQAAEIAIPTAACGIIIGIVIQSGLATKISGLIASIGISNLFFALIIAMLGCIVLGMALPTVAAYLVAVVLFVPTLTGLNIPPLQANMFVFYFGVMAQITPPVCLASFTAAGIAGADAMKTGWTAFRYALVAFLIPFVFIYDPSILMLGSPLQILRGSVVVLIGVYFLASAMAGYMNGTIGMFWRILLFVASVMLIVPETITDIVGICLGILVFILSYVKNRHEKRVKVAI